MAAVFCFVAVQHDVIVVYVLAQLTKTSKRVLYMFSALLFAAATMLCGLSVSLSVTITKSLVCYAAIRRCFYCFRNFLYVLMLPYVTRPLLP